MGIVNTSAGHGAGAGGGIGLNKPGYGPKVKHFTARSDKSSKCVELAPEIADAWKQVMDDSQSLTWLLCQYAEGSNFKLLHLRTSGCGGLDEFKAALPPDEIAWGAFRCYGVDKRGD